MPQQLLHAVSEILDRADDDSGCTRAIAGLLTSELAELCAVKMLGPDGSFDTRILRHRDPILEQRLLADHDAGGEPEGPAARVLLGRKAILGGAELAFGVLGPGAPAESLPAVVGLWPISAGSCPSGVLALGRGAPFTVEERQTAAEIARRLGDRIERTRLDGGMDRASRLTTALLQVAERLATDAEPGEALDIVAAALDADIADVLLLDPGERHLRLVASHGQRRELVGRVTVPLDGGTLAALVHRLCSTVEVADHELDGRLAPSPLLTEQQIRTSVATPIPGGGLLGVHRRRVSTFDRHEVRFVESVARLVGLALADRGRRESERRRQREYELLVENAPDVLFRFDPTLRLLYVSRSVTSMRGRAPDELVGKTLSEMGLPPELQDRWEAMLTRAIVENAEQTIRFEMAGRVFETRVVPELDEKGRLVSVAGITRDRTQVSQLEQQLQTAQKLEALGKLAGGVAHDFNNLLTVMKSCSEGLLAAHPPGDEHREEAEDIQTAVERATRLTRRLLAFSRHHPAQERVVSISQLVRETESMLRRLPPERIRVEVQLAAEGDRARIDPAQIEQVILNLVVNARDAIAEQGHIRLRVERAGDRVALVVEDDGCGMDAAVQGRIFDPFFSTKGSQGTGLGLAVVAAIVGSAGGSILVESEVGRGSRFRVLLPACDGPVSASLDDDDRADVSGTETVLLVEDDAAVRALASRALKREGYQVRAAGDPAEARRMIAEDPAFDVLVTDVIMPVQSGPAFARELLGRRPELPVVFMTGYVDDESRRLLAEGEPLLQKPFAPRKLAERVRQALDAFRERSGAGGTPPSSALPA